MKPQLGWLRCNVDTATFTSKGMVSYGGVVRHSDGSFVAAKCGCLLGKFNAKEDEALAVCKILSWLKDMQFPHVIIEMDCLQVYNTLVDKLTSPNGFGLIINDYRALVMSVREVIFSFVRRPLPMLLHE